MMSDFEIAMQERLRGALCSARIRGLGGTKAAEVAAAVLNRSHVISGSRIEAMRALIKALDPHDVRRKP